MHAYFQTRAGEKRYGVPLRDPTRELNEALASGEYDVVADLAETGRIWHGGVESRRLRTKPMQALATIFRHRGGHVAATVAYELNNPSDAEREVVKARALLDPGDRRAWKIIKSLPKLRVARDKAPAKKPEVEYRLHPDADVSFYVVVRSPPELAYASFEEGEPDVRLNRWQVEPAAGARFVQIAGSYDFKSGRVFICLRAAGGRSSAMHLPPPSLAVGGLLFEAVKEDVELPHFPPGGMFPKGVLHLEAGGCVPEFYIAFETGTLLAKQARFERAKGTDANNNLPWIPAELRWYPNGGLYPPETGFSLQVSIFIDVPPKIIQMRSA